MEGDNSHVGGCDSFTPTPMSSPVEYPNSSPVDSPSARNETETQATSPSVEGVPKVGEKRLRSTVWEHFTKIKVNGVNKAECNYCKKLLGGESKNGTTHLHDHHKICKMRPHQHLRQQTLTLNKDKDGKVIVKHEYLLNMVEHSGFREFMNICQPLLKMPSRNTVRSDILKMYEAQKTTLMESMNRNSSRVALTTDMWTSNQKKGYMAITAHYVDNNWSLHNLILRFIYVPTPHTSLALSKEMMKCVLDWNLERKLSAITVDNCSTNDSLIDHVLSKLNRRHLLFGGKFFHMRCCAHILNLIVQDGLKVLGHGLERVRDSVSFWLATPKRQQIFKENATHLGIEYSKQLVQDCKTRWNSTYLMLSVALQYKDVFSRLEHQESSFVCAPLEQDWELAENICEKLKVFYKASNAFSGRKYPTSNIFFLLMSEIKVNLSTWVESTDLVIVNMAKSMLAKFDKYWEAVHGVLAVANVLDPRYKLGVVQFFFNQFYGDEAAQELEKVKTYCRDLCREYECSSTFASRRTRTNVEGENLNQDDPVRDKLKSFMQSSHMGNLETSELDIYLEAKRLPFEEELDILTWWRVAGKNYPTLSKVARDILAIPVSTVASESAFSTSGRLVSPHRSRLHPNILEALMCSQSWLLESNIISETYEIDEDLFHPNELEVEP